MSQQKAVLVLGMHRSGTSALTGALGFLGVDLGNHLMPAAPGENPKGFFEHMPVYELNEKILKSLHKAWWSLGDVNSQQASELQQFQKEGRELIRRDFEKSPVFAFKDPRNARLLPFWLSVLEQLEIDVVTLLSIRSPQAVYKSLFKRNDFPQLKSYILWSQHYLGILRALETVDLVIHYDELVEQPATCIMAIADRLGRTPDSQALEEVSQSFIDPELRHVRSEASSDGFALFSHANALYSAIRAFHLMPATTESFSRECEALRADLEPYLSLLDEYDSWGTELVTVRRDNEQLRMRTGELEHRCEEKSREAATLISQHAQLTTQVVPLQQELTSALSKNGELQSQLARAESQVVDLRTQLASLELQLAHRTQIETQLVETQSQLARVESHMLQVDTERLRLETQLSHTASELASAQTDLANAEVGLSRAQSQIAVAESRLATSESQLAQVRAQFTQAEAQRAQTQSRLAFTENELLLSRNHIVNIEAVVHILRSEIRVSQAETARLRTAEARLGHRVTSGAYGFLERHPRLLRALSALR